MEFTGDFETHLTLDARTPKQVVAASRWARENKLKFTHIELDRGASASQPMVTYHGHGTLTGELGIAEKWGRRLAEAGFPVTRTKIEASPLNSGVPRTREEAQALPDHCYFEHHIKLLLAPDADLEALSRLVEPHRARLSRNARRTRADGYQERFVTQRCSRVGHGTADTLFERLSDALRRYGLNRVAPWQRRRSETPIPGVLDTEREFVVYDSALELDAGWMDAAPVADLAEAEPAEVRRWFEGQGRYPSTHMPITAGPHAKQEKVFDPALKHFVFAFRPSEPVFEDQDLGAEWWQMQGFAMEHVLAAISATPWRDHLVLRGSALMPLWVGPAARRPRDLDFVVVPADMEPIGGDAERMIEDIVEEVCDGVPDMPGLTFDRGGVSTESIWTYERAEGRRVVIPWSWEDLPRGSVQIDVVFREPLPEEPVRAVVGREEVLAASPELSLAWKVLWLFTDTYPQGKDLYDAVLLAENSSLDRDLLMRVLAGPMAEELGVDAETLDEGFLLAEGTDAHIDAEWEHFVRECPWVEGTCAEWLGRFEAAMAPVFRRK
ncbi:nucleotidyl transferase AbiEii/AbiGii toxin family protein [Nocardiopsis sp. RSe5-2]|uniref:Nucleotidyl transferase AbiEii/AbiGii toxin family protein n=1 Tax=Nocardiopsis endophytica TaxID=3018445 RepID=A0ABT4U003_9ACTN|nr:nucleotidyl transferase AbiEii/AbiGii toxin family protein [Nocardiopsis endophytica]MDA2810283.1 nucleotidyl transferase AbiEii/AbiGii toxin family protein [Nocardiopsis endophytica]